MDDQNLARRQGPFLAGLVFMLGLLDSVDAAADFKKCCVIAARSQYTLFAPTLPWDACAINSNATGGSSAPINPSVNVTLGWCERNCPGYQPSSTGEWLHPITTWLIPYAGLLLLCPIGERGEVAIDRSVSWCRLLFRWFPETWQGWLNRTNSMLKWMSNFMFSLSAYGGYLGDPATSIGGSFSALAEDWWLSGTLLHMTDLRRELVAAVILTGQTQLDVAAEKRLTESMIRRFLLDIIAYEDSRAKHGSEDEKSQIVKAEGIRGNPAELTNISSKILGTVVVEEDLSSRFINTEARRKLKSFLDKDHENPWHDLDASKLAKAILLITEGHNPPVGLFPTGSNEFVTTIDQVLRQHTKRDYLERKERLNRGGTFTYRLWEGIRVLLEARVDFVNTILIPVILMLVVTASVFYDAYQALGDNDTAQSLAYGLLYSWLIVLAVAANCYTSSLTSGLVERTIGDTAQVLPIPPDTGDLRQRHSNSLRWRDWLHNVGIVEGQIPTRRSVAVKYLAIQLVGWACVAIVASCGAAISYTTPPIGIGCQSFNMLLYALVSLVVCLIPVLLYWHESGDPVEDAKGTQKSASFKKYVGWLYHFLVFANGCVLLIGTMLNLIGVFRSCRCMNVFASHSRVLELNTQTQQAVHNATVYWLPVGYVAFTFIWCVSAAAIIMRQVINFRVSIIQGLCLGETTYHGGRSVPAENGSSQQNNSGHEGGSVHVDQNTADDKRA